MGRAVPPLPIYAFMECRSTNLLLSLNSYEKMKQVLGLKQKQPNYRPGQALRVPGN
jgi:hypothetical protein